MFAYCTGSEKTMARLFEPRVDDITNELHTQLVEAFLAGLSPAMKDKYLVSLIESELKATVSICHLTYESSSNLIIQDYI